MNSVAPESSALLLAPAYNHGDYLAAESLGLRSVAAGLIKAGAEVHVVDESPNPPGAEVLAQARESALIGVGALFTRQIPDAIALVRTLRQASPQAHITMGGQGVYGQWERVMQEVEDLDSVCMNEADETIRDLWHGLQSQKSLSHIPGLFLRSDSEVYSTGPRPPVEDLDSLPFPLRSAAYKDAHATVCTSRGCAAHCTFCQSGNYGNRYHTLPRWRFRSPENIVAEIEYLYHTHGIRMVSFVDDDFLGGDGRGHNRALRLAALLKESSAHINFSIECRIDEMSVEILRALREVGLRHVLIGVESANPTDLALFAKRTPPERAAWAIQLLRGLDIEFSVGFIMFQPLSVPDGIRSNLAFLRDHNVGTYRRVSNRLEIYPGSPLLRYFEKRGVAFREDSYRLYYDFHDTRMAALYENFRNLLAPFEDVENSCARALFRLRGSEASEDPAGIAAVQGLFDRVTRQLLTSASELTDAVERGGPAKARVAEIGERVVQHVARYSEELGRITTNGGDAHVDHGK